MKKIATLIVSLSVIAFANAQNLKTDKTIKPVEPKIVVNKVSKPIINNHITNDSAKTTKVVIEKVIVKDTIIVPTGKLKPFKTDAHASYYADKFTGRKCASGKIFDNKKYYAAHKKLPFGTKLKVTNESNKKFVIVEVVDRGPFVKGRELDLSKSAFMDITSKKGAGAVIVTIEIISK